MTMSQYEPPRPLEPEYGRRMTHAEAVLLCRYAKAACPQQAFDEYTPDAWSDLLGDLRFVDCKEALREVVKRKPFVAPAEIREEVKRIRSRRLSAFGPIPETPLELRDNPAEDHAWQVRTMRAVCDGELTRADMPEPEPVSEVQAAEVRAKIAAIRAGLSMDDA